MAEPARIVPRFAGDGYGPGDIVEGVLEVVEPVEGVRTLNAYLRYLDRSPDFSGAVTADRVEPLHEGPVEQGQEIPFELRLPADALPNWDDPATAELGTLSWALVVEADIARGLDKTITHAVPVNPDAGAWPGPEPSGEEEMKRTVKGWDVEIEPDRWALRRGEELSLDVSIGKPKADRDTLQVGLTCQVGLDVEVTTTDSSGDPDIRRQTNWVDLFEDWPPVDPSASSQRVGLRVPDDGPFSYAGTALGFVWMAVAREQRRLRSDPRRIAILQVRP